MNNNNPTNYENILFHYKWNNVNKNKLSFKKNGPYPRKNVREYRINKNELIEIDPSIIHYDKIKKNIQSYFPNCYKGNIKIILYRLYLISLDLNNHFFDTDKNIKLLLHTTFIVLQSNIDSLGIDNIYGFFKVRIKYKNGSHYDTISNNIEMRIVCDYLLERSFIKAYTLLINSNMDLNKLNYNNNIYQITPFKEDVIIYKIEDIQLLIQQYVFDIQSDNLMSTALSKCVFKESENISDVIDLDKMTGMYVLSHSDCLINDICVVPNNTMCIFLQKIGNKCVYYPSILGNTNLLVVYEILHIISQELNKENPDLDNIEKILLSNKILSDIYNKEYFNNSLKVYIPGKTVFNQTIVFQEKKEYTLQSLIEASKLKKTTDVISNGIISFENMLKKNKIYPIHTRITTKNNLIDITNNDINLPYKNVVEKYPLSISSKTTMSRVLDENNTYYQSLNKIIEYREPLLSDLFNELHNSQKEIRTFNNVKTSLTRLTHIEHKENKEKKIKYFDNQLKNKGYVKIGKLNVFIFSMCRSIMDNEGIVIEKDKDKIIIPIPNKQNLVHIINIIDSLLNYNLLVYRFSIKKQIISLESLLDKIYKRIQYTSYSQKLKNPMMRGAMYQYNNFSNLTLSGKVNVINDFYRIQFNSELKYYIDPYDQLQYLSDSPLRHKINYTIFILMRIDLGLQDNLKELLEYYNQNYLFKIQSDEEYYTKTLPMSDYIFLYYLSTF